LGALGLGVRFPAGECVGVWECGSVGVQYPHTHILTHAQTSIGEIIIMIVIVIAGEDYDYEHDYD
jgi:hypothetical protein